MLREVAPPTAEPVSVTEVRIHLRQMTDGDSPASPPVPLESTPDDSWVKAKITAARQMAEQFLGFGLTDAVYAVTYPGFTGATTSASAAAPIHLPPNAGAVTRIDYLDAANTLQTLPGSSYSVDAFDGSLYIAGTLPVLSTRPTAVRVYFHGAYSSTASPAYPVPQAIKHAILLAVGHWYANREASAMNTLVEVAYGWEALLRPYRVRTGLA